jgi:hypothetical protein
VRVLLHTTPTARGACAAGYVAYARLYERGDLHRAEYVARREATNAELSALTPAPIPDVDQAQAVLEDFTIFCEREADSTAKRRLLSLIFDNVWLDQDRVVAVQPQAPFLPFFQHDRAPRQRNGRGKVRERRKSSPVLTPHIECRVSRCFAGLLAVTHCSIGRRGSDSHRCQPTAPLVAGAGHIRIFPGPRSSCSSRRRTCWAFPLGYASSRASSSHPRPHPGHKLRRPSYPPQQTSSHQHERQEREAPKGDRASAGESLLETTSIEIYVERHPRQQRPRVLVE